jgi:DNA-binding transcriptional regulator YiaG
MRRTETKQTHPLAYQVLESIRKQAGLNTADFSSLLGLKTPAVYWGYANPKRPISTQVKILAAMIFKRPEAVDDIREILRELKEG